MGYRGLLDADAIDAGLLRPIAKSPAALAVFIAYASRANANGEAWRSETTIALAFGIKLDSVRRGRRACEKAGLLTFTRRYHNRAKVYKVNMSPRTAAGCDTPLESTSPPAHKSASPRTKHRDTPHGGGANTQGIKKETDRSTSAADGVVDALADAGIGEPTRTDLANAEGITAELVRRVVELVHDAGGGPGLIVTRLREALMDATKSAREGRKRDDDRKWWDAMTDSERDMWRRRVRDRYPNLASQPDDKESWPAWAAKLRDEGCAP